MMRQQVGFEYGKVIIMNTTPLSATKLSLEQVVSRFIAAFQQVINANPTCRKYEMAYPANASYAEVEAIKDYCVSQGLKVTHLEGPPRMCLTLPWPVDQPEFVITPSVPAPQPEGVVTPAVPAPQPAVVRDEIVNLFFRTLQAQMSGVPTTCNYVGLPYPADATPAERTAINDKCIAEGFCVDSTTLTDRVILTIFTPARQRFMAKFIPAPAHVPAPVVISWQSGMSVSMAQASGRTERTPPVVHRGPWYEDPKFVNAWFEVGDSFVNDGALVDSRRVIEFTRHQMTEAVRKPTGQKKRTAESRAKSKLALLKYKMVSYLEQSSDAGASGIVDLNCFVDTLPEGALMLLVKYLESLDHSVELTKIASPRLSRDSNKTVIVPFSWAMRVISRRPATLDYKE